MNLYGMWALYCAELSRMWRTLFQSVASPIISTSLYFIVFGSAIGSRMEEVGSISYAAFIIPGLIMMMLLNQSITNASFGIYMPKFTGTLYEVLSAPMSPLEIVVGYVGAAATKSVLLGVLILLTARTGAGSSAVTSSLARARPVCLARTMRRAAAPIALRRAEGTCSR